MPTPRWKFTFYGNQNIEPLIELAQSLNSNLLLQAGFDLFCLT